MVDGTTRYFVCGQTALMVCPVERPELPGASLVMAYDHAQQAFRVDSSWRRRLRVAGGAGAPLREVSAAEFDSLLLTLLLTLRRH